MLNNLNTFAATTVLPSISFFIPAYNCATTVSESVNSIMATNFKQGDELIIVNDCATDNTDAVLSELQQQYPVIKLFAHKRNKGGAAARNTAVENTSNELLFCLDADNVLAQNSVQPLVNFMLEQKADIAFFNELRYFENTTDAVDETWHYKPGIFTKTELLSGERAPGASGNYLFTKSSWLKAKGYSEDLGALDTWAFGFKQLMEGCKMVIMPNSFYYHRRGYASYYITDAWNKRRSVSLRLIKLIINYIDYIHPDDVEYIFSKKGRYSWFENLDKRPIRLVDKPVLNSIWDDHVINDQKSSFSLNSLKQKATRLKRIITKRDN